MLPAQTTTMLRKKQHEAKAESVEASNVTTALFLGVLAVVLLLTGNLAIASSLWVLCTQQPNAHADLSLWANILYVAAALLGVLLIDAQSVKDMFARIPLSGKCPPNIFVALFRLHKWERTICVITVVVNWMTSHGLICSGLKLGMAKPLPSDSVKMSSEILHDLVSGDLPLNPLIRTWTWESLYGMTCGLYLATFFVLSVAHRMRFNAWRLAPWAICSTGLYLSLLALTGLLRQVSNRGEGWIGPSEGLWLAFLHTSIVYMAYSQWQSMHHSKSKKSLKACIHSPKSKHTKDVSAVDSPNAMLWFADKNRGWKPITVFALTSFLSVVFAHASWAYPFVLVLVYGFYLKSHRMNRGWNKILFILNITHHVLHFFVHSYRTLEDQPLLWVDKLVHFLFGVVAWQQFRDNRELLSRDPLVKLFNYINMYVWIPGDIVSLYIAGFHGPSDWYLWHMIKWGGYCLSTGTAMAFVNNDVEEDSAPNSSRRFIVARNGLTGHGVQILQALAFAVLYIVVSGGSAQMGWQIEYVYDYAAHLYVGYGAM